MPSATPVCGFAGQNPVAAAVSSAGARGTALSCTWIRGDLRKVGRSCCTPPGGLHGPTMPSATPVCGFAGQSPIARNFGPVFFVNPSVPLRERSARRFFCHPLIVPGNRAPERPSLPDETPLRRGEAAPAKARHTSERELTFISQPSRLITCPTEAHV
jgi:hypothetical protein